VVVGTNIAETSITIEDVVYVVDSGKVKERRYNPQRGMSMLVLCHISQARGRARFGSAKERVSAPRLRTRLLA